METHDKMGKFKKPILKRSPYENPNSHGELGIQANRSKNGALYQKVKVQNIKRKHHLEPLSGGALKTSGGNFKVKTFTSKYRAIFSETFEPLCSTCIWNLYVAFSFDVEP